MAKELVLAILLGSFLGFGLAGTSFGIKKIITKATIGPKISAPTPGQISPPNEITISSYKESTLTPATANTDNLDNLVITTPQNYALVSDQNLEITGHTQPNYSVLIQNTNKEYITISDNNGVFKQQITLNQNLNLITVVSISPNNQEETTTLTITHTNAKI